MKLVELGRQLRELRLRRFSELSHRLLVAAQAKAGLLKLRYPADKPSEDVFLRALRPAAAESLDQFSHKFDERTAPQFYFDPRNDAATVSQLHNNFKFTPQLNKAADDIVEGRFQFLGSQAMQFSDDVDWHASFVGQQSWPKSHWSVIPFKRLGHLGDIKIAWEFNRHQIFVVLGRAYRHTGDEKYADTFVRLLNSWCDQNPPNVGIHYISNLEIGLRCISWIWAHFLFAPSGHYDMRTRGRLHLCLYYMARRLARHIGYTEKTGRNNHLIGDAACLAVIAIVYPEFKASERWLQHALKLLWSALVEQVLPDGMHFEISFGYHAFVIELYLQVVLLLKKNGATSQIPQAAMDVLEKMIEVLARTTAPDGTLINLNDADNGVVLALHDKEQERIRSMIAIGAELFGRADFKAFAETKTEAVPEQAFWLHAEGLSPFYQRQSAFPQGCDTALPHAGIYVMRSNWTAAAHLGLVNNHPDPFPNSGHNHACLLQLVLWVGGQPLIIDGGTYRYNADEGFRNSLRGTFAHNTVVVDGQDQAITHRNFGWLSKLDPTWSSWQSNERFALFDGAHDGYQRLTEPIRHRRTILWIRDPCVWLIRDCLTGYGSHQFEQLWHFPRGVVENVRDGGLVDLSLGNGSDVRMQLVMSEGDRLRLVTADSGHPWVWGSPRYGELEPRNSVSLTWTASVPTQRITLIAPGREEPALAAGLEFDDRCIRLRQLNYELLFEEQSVYCHCSNALINPEPLRIPQ